MICPLKKFLEKNEYLPKILTTYLNSDYFRIVAHLVFLNSLWISFFLSFFSQYFMFSKTRYFLFIRKPTSVTIKLFSEESLHLKAGSRIRESGEYDSLYSLTDLGDTIFVFPKIVSLRSNCIPQNRIILLNCISNCIP